MSTFDKLVLNRRQLVSLGMGASAAVWLAGCAQGSGSASASSATDDKGVMTDEQEAPKINADEFKALLAKGPVATDEAIQASEWAKKIHDSGELRVGGVETSTFFSLLDVSDQQYRGFDAGLFQLLARYLTGDESKFALTQVTSSTRESVLENGTVDAVFATYSVTPERQQKIDFAGPYYTSQQSILVAKSNEDIKGLDSLAGKNVAVQSGSTGPTIMEKLCPDAVLQQFTTDEEARLALEQGRVDAYVIDNTMQMGAVAKNPNKYKIVGEVFGDIDPYGIGLPKGAAGAVEFVNTFLTDIEQAGLWAELWKVCIGDRVGQTDAPEPPAIGKFA